MTFRRPQARLGATLSGPRPGCFPLGSAQSKAAARALLVARKASEEELRFKVVSIVNGSRVNLDGLADRIKSAFKNQGGELPDSLPAREDERESNEGAWGECLSERIKAGRERIAQTQ